MATINSFRGKVPYDLLIEEPSYVMNSTIYALGNVYGCLCSFCGGYLHIASKWRIAFV